MTPPPPPPDPRCGVRGQIASASAELAQLPGRVTGLSDAELVACSEEIEALGRLVDATRVRLADEVDARSEGVGDARLSAQYGCRNAVELLERATGCSVRSIRARIALGRATRARTALSGEPLPARFAHVAAGMDAGLLGLDTAALLTGLLGKAAPRVGASELAAAEAELVAHALGLDTVSADDAPADSAADDADAAAAGIEALRDRATGALAANGLSAGSVAVGNGHADRARPTHWQVEACAQAWIAWLDQDGIDPEAQRVERRRGLWLGAARDGLIPLRGNLVPEVAAGLQRLLDAHRGSSVRFRSDQAGPAGPEAPGPGLTGHDPATLAAQAVSVDGVPVSDQAWSADERPHDPRTPAQRRHDDLGSIVQAAARAAETPNLGGAAPTLLVTVSTEELANGAAAHLDGIKLPVPGALAHRIACTGAIQRVVFDQAGRITALGSSERLFNAAQRRAITARDGGCVIPGCSTPASWCEIHHVQEYADGGPTHTDNGVMLCWWHHHHLEESGWRIRMIRGIPHVRAPGLLDPYGTWRPAHHARARQRTRARSRTRGRTIPKPQPT